MAKRTTATLRAMIITTAMATRMAMVILHMVMATLMATATVVWGTDMATIATVTILMAPALATNFLALAGVMAMVLDTTPLVLAPVMAMALGTTPLGLALGLAVGGAALMAASEDLLKAAHGSTGVGLAQPALGTASPSSASGV
jgi:glycogen synthase